VLRRLPTSLSRLVSGLGRPQSPRGPWRRGLSHSESAGTIHNAPVAASVYPDVNRLETDRAIQRGYDAMQTTRPRDLGALVLVVGLFLILLVVVLFVAPSAQ
jgi:hypothetical protein